MLVGGCLSEQIHDLLDPILGCNPVFIADAGSARIEDSIDVRTPFTRVSYEFHGIDGADRLDLATGQISP